MLIALLIAITVLLLLVAFIGGLIFAQLKNVQSTLNKIAIQNATQSMGDVFPTGMPVPNFLRNTQL